MMLSLISLIVALAALAAAVIAMQRLGRIAKSIERIDNELETLATPAAVTPSAPAADNVVDLQRRVAALEQTLGRAPKSPRQADVADTCHAKAPTDTRAAFGDVINSDVAYFTRLLPADDADAIFSASVDSPTTASFTLRSLAMAKSFDFIDSAIDFTGTATKSTATAMTTLTPGLATLADGRWVITRKTRISLS